MLNDGPFQADVVKKLRDRAAALNNTHTTITASDAVHIMREAADLIERLEKEVVGARYDACD